MKRYVTILAILLVLPGVLWFGLASASPTPQTAPIPGRASTTIVHVAAPQIAYSVTVNGCQLWSPYPDIANGTVRALGAIDCTMTGHNHSLKLEVCGRVWNGSAWSTKQDTCANYAASSAAGIGSPSQGNYAASFSWTGVSGHVYVSWVWTDVDGVTGTHQSGPETCC